MKPREDLFYLIKALSPTEKGSLGMIPPQHEYQYLYKELNEIKAYDEKEFLNSDSGQRFAGNFSVAKNELYEKILQSIRAHKKSAASKKPIEIQLREQLEDAIFLREKKLFDQSERRLMRAKKGAQDHQLHEILLEILRIERTALLRSQDAGYSQELTRLHAEIQKASEVIMNKVKMLYLYDLYFLEVRQFRNLQGQVNHALLDELIIRPELTDLALCLSFEAESNFYFCHTIHHYLKGNAHEAWEFARTLYLRWQEQKNVQKVKAVEYRNILQNYLTFCNYASQYDDFEAALLQLMAGPFHSHEEQATAVDNGLHVNMQRCLNLCDWEGAKRSIHDFRQQLDLVSERLIPSRIMTHYISFSRLFIVLEDYQEAIKWAKKIISLGKGEESTALVLQARVQELIALHEQPTLGDFGNKYRAATRALKQTASEESLEAKIIRVLAKIETSTKKGEAVAAFEQLLRSIEEDGQTPAADAFTLTWLRAKAKRTPLRRMLESECK